MSQCTSYPQSYRANKLLTPEEAFGERAKDVDFKPKRSLEEELDVLKDKVFKEFTNLLWTMNLSRWTLIIGRTSVDQDLGRTRAHSRQFVKS